MKPIKELLIIRMSALGDVAMTIPIIYLLAEQNPSISIRVLTRERFKGLFFSCPANISIISCDFGLSNGILGIWRLFKCIKKYHIDAIADLHGILRSYILDFLFAITGTKVAIVHKSRSKRKALTRLKNKRKVQQKSFFDRYVEVFKRLGLDVQLSQNSSYLPVITKEDRKENIKRIGIAPFARYFTKVYPAELMKTVINNLSQKGYAIYLFGNGAHEYNIMQSLIAESPNASIVPDKLSFQEQLEFMATLDVMVSMDSANMHLASLVNSLIRRAGALAVCENITAVLPFIATCRGEKSPSTFSNAFLSKLFFTTTNLISFLKHSRLNLLVFSASNASMSVK
jgi:ADP-heptose:LPS heptosyltransferase